MGRPVAHHPRHHHHHLARSSSAARDGDERTNGRRGHGFISLSALPRFNSSLARARAADCLSLPLAPSRCSFQFYLSRALPTLLFQPSERIVLLVMRFYPQGKREGETEFCNYYGHCRCRVPTPPIFYGFPLFSAARILPNY